MIFVRWSRSSGLPRPDHGLSPYCSTSENGPFLHKSKSSSSPHLAATPRVFAFPSSPFSRFSPPSLSTRLSLRALCLLGVCYAIQKRHLASKNGSATFPFGLKARLSPEWISGVRERETRCAGSSRTPLTSARRRHVLSTFVHGQV